MNNSPSNIFLILLLLESYRQNSQPILAATGMHGINIKHTDSIDDCNRKHNISLKSELSSANAPVLGYRVLDSVGV